AQAAQFKGKDGSALDLVAPEGLKVARLVVIGLGKPAENRDFAKLGGMAMSRIPAGTTDVSVVLDLPAGPLKPEQAADVALGLRLRAYSFDRYKTRRK